MIVIKSCPRCLGDMMREELLGEADMVCLQCGNRSPAPIVASQRRSYGATPTKKAA